MNIGYACTDCYILAHDSGHTHPLKSIDPYDINLTDWVCTEGTINIDGFCVDSDDTNSVCSNCDSSGTGFGITVGGACQLGEHDMQGYWEYHTYIIH